MDWVISCSNSIKRINAGAKSKCAPANGESYGLTVESWNQSTSIFHPFTRKPLGFSGFNWTPSFTWEEIWNHSKPALTTTSTFEYQEKNYRINQKTKIHLYWPTILQLRLEAGPREEKPHGRRSLESTQHKTQEMDHRHNNHQCVCWVWQKSTLHAKQPHSATVFKGNSIRQVKVTEHKYIWTDSNRQVKATDRNCIWPDTLLRKIVNHAK